MLRGNLSTRPFYNERLATLVLGSIAVAAVVLTGFNVWRLSVLSGERADVMARLEATRRDIDRVETNTTTLRRSVDRPTLARLATSAREANGLIEARTFSWTTLLGQLEKTLPFDVRLTAVTPRVDRGQVYLSLRVVARDFDDLDDFVEALGESGAFEDVVPAEQRRNEDGQHAAVIDALYHPPALAPAEPVRAVAPAAGGKP